MTAKKSSLVDPKSKTKYRVRNWPEYDKALKNRGDVTVWLNEDAIEGEHKKPWGTPETGVGRARTGRPDMSEGLGVRLGSTWNLTWNEASGQLPQVFLSSRSRGRHNCVALRSTMIRTTSGKSGALETASHHLAKEGPIRTRSRPTDSPEETSPVFRLGDRYRPRQG